MKQYLEAKSILDAGRVGNALQTAGNLSGQKDLASAGKAVSKVGSYEGSNDRNKAGRALDAALTVGVAGSAIASTKSVSKAASKMTGDTLKSSPALTKATNWSRHRVNQFAAHSGKAINYMYTNRTGPLATAGAAAGASLMIRGDTAEKRVLRNSLRGFAVGAGAGTIVSPQAGWLGGLAGAAGAGAFSGARELFKKGE